MVKYKRTGTYWYNCSSRETVSNVPIIPSLSGKEINVRNVYHVIESTKRETARNVNLSHNNEGNVVDRRNHHDEIKKIRMSN